MSKKKIDKRLDKLFEDINKEPETKQTKGSTGNGSNGSKQKESPFSMLPVEEAPEPFSDIDLSTLAEQAPVSKGVYTSPSTMLSTAFRTDENNWATLKVVDELGHRTWGTEDQLLVKQVADQLSLALENARLFQQAQRRAREMTALAEVAREISATLELQVVLERISHQAMEILNAVTSAVYVPDPDFKTLIAITAIGADAEEIKSDPLQMGQGILGNIALRKVAEMVNFASSNPNAITIKGTEDYIDEHLMAAPILSKDQLSGLLVVWRIGTDQAFLDNELEFLVSLAQQASIAVENARLFEETKRRSEELASLNEIISAASQTLDTKSILETVMKKVLEISGFDGGLITIFNDTLVVFSTRIAFVTPTHGAVFYKIGKRSAEKKGLWPYGPEYPVKSLEKQCRTAGLTVLKEYTICFKENLAYFSYVSKTLRSILKIFVKPFPERLLIKLFGGYLLVTVAVRQE